MNQIFTEKDFVTTNWSGGKTTELFIYPKETSFKNRDFSFRLSTATVEVETSLFTALPGVERTLMVLDGEMELRHKNQHKVNLKAFEEDHFNGAWETLSEGKCTDFNLMTRNKTKGSISVLNLTKDERSLINTDSGNNFFCIYLLKGELSVQTTKEKYLIKEQNLLVLSVFDFIEIAASSISKALLISVQ